MIMFAGYTESPFEWIQDTEGTLQASAAAKEFLALVLVSNSIRENYGKWYIYYMSRASRLLRRHMPKDCPLFVPHLQLELYEAGHLKMSEDVRLELVEYLQEQERNWYRDCDEHLRRMNVFADVNILKCAKDYFEQGEIESLDARYCSLCGIDIIAV